MPAIVGAVLSVSVWMPLKRFLPAAPWGALALLAILHHEHDGRARAPARDFTRRFTLDLRRPDYAEAARLQPAFDLENSVLAEAALADALGTVRLGELTPSLREVWLDAIPRLDRELEAARDLALTSIVARPGWAIHRLQLGELVYTAARRRPNRPVPSDRWAVPLETAHLAAPGLNAPARFLAGAYLESWEGLSEERRVAAGGVLRRAFQDPEFAERAFEAALQTLGFSALAPVLPEDARVLRRLRDSRALQNEVDAYLAIYRRWEAAERRARAEDLAVLEAKSRRRDRIGLQQACYRWAAEHAAWELDEPEERRKAARVLELWPADEVISWTASSTAPRVRLVRFFLDGRLSAVGPGAIARALSSFTNVPDPLRARAVVLTGDRADIDAVSREAESSFEWTPFFVALAHYELSAGRRDLAVQALSRIAPLARGECDVRALERALELREAPQEPKQLTFTPEDFSPRGDLSLCLGPEDAASSLTVILTSSSRSVIEYGWDGGRIGVALVEEPAPSRAGYRVTLAVALANVPVGRRTFYVRTLAGPTFSVDGARLGPKAPEGSEPSKRAAA